jgi:hypothetical protein
MPMELIKDKTFMKIGKKTTICLLTLDNGFEITGTSACVDPANFDYEIGKEQAELDALRKFGSIVGFVYTEKLHLEKESIITTRKQGADDK